MHPGRDRDARIPRSRECRIREGRTGRASWPTDGGPHLRGPSKAALAAFWQCENAKRKRETRRPMVDDDTPIEIGIRGCVGVLVNNLRARPARRGRELQLKVSESRLTWMTKGELSEGFSRSFRLNETLPKVFMAVARFLTRRQLTRDIDADEDGVPGRVWRGTGPPIIGIRHVGGKVNGIFSARLAHGHWQSKATR